MKSIKSVPIFALLTTLSFLSLQAQDGIHVAPLESTHNSERPGVTSNESPFDFECVPSENGYRPRHREFKKLLGAGVFKSENKEKAFEICQKAVQASKNGIVCSATGLPGGYKPTYLKGVTISRPDWGYIGGTSMTLEACLFATQNSLPDFACYFGGRDGVMVGDESMSGWYATHPTGNRQSKGGPFTSLKQCVETGQQRLKKPESELKGLFEVQKK